MLDYLKFRIRKHLFGEAVLAEAASEVIELCQEELTAGYPAHYLPNQLSKVIRCHAESNMGLEVARISGGERQHAPTLAYTICGTIIKPNIIYKGRSCSRFPSNSNFDSRQAVVEDSPLVLVSSWSGVKYFGHWMSEDIPTYMLAETFGQPISFESGHWPHKNYYAKIFEQDWRKYYLGHAHKLTVFQDFSENSLKAQRYRELRKRLRNKYTPRYGDHLVYLKRGHGGANARKVYNEEQLINELQKKGFHIIDLESASFDGMITTLLDARLVITVEGSQAIHCLNTLEDKGNLLLITPPRMFNNVHKGWTEALNMEYGFIVGDDIDEHYFSVNVDELMQTIDLML